MHSTTCSGRSHLMNSTTNLVRSICDVQLPVQADPTWCTVLPIEPVHMWCTALPIQANPTWCTVLQYYQLSQVHLWCTAPLQYLLFGQPTWCTALPILSVYLMYSILLYTHSVIPPYVQHYLQSAHLIIKITISLPTVYLLLPNWQHSIAMKREKMGNVDKISSINTQGIFPLLFWRHSGSSFSSRFCRKIRTFGRFGISWNKGKSTVCNTRISHHLFDHFWCIKGTVSQELHQSKIAVAYYAPVLGWLWD